MPPIIASEVQLIKVFSSDFDFHIPDYQRPYAWEVAHARQLLDDLVEVLDRSDEEPYFLGSIVLVKLEDSAKADVIDGQQRLTTLTILLSILRDRAPNDEVRAELRTMVQEPGKVLQSLEAKPRLSLRAQDRDFFHDYVQTDGRISALLGLPDTTLSTDAQKAVKANNRCARRPNIRMGSDAPRRASHASRYADVPRGRNHTYTGERVPDL